METPSNLIHVVQLSEHRLEATTVAKIDQLLRVLLIDILAQDAARSKLD